MPLIQAPLFVDAAVTAPLPCLGFESWTRSAALSASTSATAVQWDNAGASLSGGPTLRDGTNTERFNMPTGATFAIVNFRCLANAFSVQTLNTRVRINGSNVRRSTFYGQGWGPYEIAAVVPVTAGDYIDVTIQGTGSQALSVGVNVGITVRVF